MPAVATSAPGTPPSRYPMKVAVVKTGPRSDLADGNRIDQLFIRQPAQVLHEIGVQVSQQHIPAAIQGRPNFEEVQE